VLLHKDLANVRYPGEDYEANLHERNSPKGQKIIESDSRCRARSYTVSKLVASTCVPQRGTFVTYLT
jgi:hypothetical protein